MLNKNSKELDCFSFIVGCLGDGGQEKQLLHLLTSLSKEYKIFLFVWDINESDKNYPCFKELDINMVGLPQKSIFSKIKKIRTVLKKETPLVLHSYTFYLNFITFISTIFFTTKGIGGLRSSAKEELNLNKYRTTLDLLFPKHIISNNYSSLNYLKSHWLFKTKSSFYVISNKLEVKKFNVSKIPSKKILTRSIGRIDDNKRIDLIIGLVNNLRLAGIDIRHKHAGEGPLKDKLNKVVKNLGLEKSFTFSGNVSDINSFLYETTFFIHTANTEGSPNVVIEAMACGKAILTTNCGDVSIYIADNINGFVVPTGDLDMLIRSAYNLINDLPTLRKMGKANRDYAQKNFGLNTLKKNTLEIYSKIITS